MSEAAIDYLAMAEFLKPRGYTFEQGQNNDFHIRNYQADDWYGFEYGEAPALKTALNHWLTGELGRKWGDMWYSDFQKDFVFSPDELEAIETAIRHYESLEAQE